MKDILERDRSGEPVSCDEPDYYKIKAVIDKAKRLLGYDPHFDMRAGLKEAVKWYWKNLK